MLLAAGVRAYVDHAHAAAVAQQTRDGAVRSVLFARPEVIAAEAKKVLDSFGPGNTGHVFNLGHGISQFTPPESVTALVEAVHGHSRSSRK